MAAVAGGRGSGITGRVAGDASDRCVSTGKWENSSLVIKGRWIPSGRGMALGTVMIEVVGDMIRVSD